VSKVVFGYVTPCKQHLRQPTRCTTGKPNTWNLIVALLRALQN